MALKSLKPRHDDAVVHHGLTRLLVIDSHPSSNSEEVEHRQTTGVASRTASGKGVVGTSTVVTQNLGRVLSNEQPTVVLAPHPNLHSILGLNFQMLGGNVIADRNARIDGIA